jgi:uncharacterized membrane protein YqjE
MTPASPRRNYFETLRSFGGGVLGAVQERLQLFSIELQEEKLRLVQTLVWTGVGLFAGMMTLTFASLAVVYLFWESARLAALGGLSVFYAAALGVAIFSLRRHLTRHPRPFAGTMNELKEDIACIQAMN